MAGPGAVDDVLRAIAGQAEAPKYIRAYHGSPADFDRFDASKIGTGEGAQMYGHGFYFAGAEPTAKHYRDTLSGFGVRLQDGSVAPLPGTFSEQRLADGSLSRMRDAWARNVGRMQGQEQQVALRELAAMNALADGAPLTRSAGHMYEVDLGVPEKSLLDWDAPLRSQPVVAQRIPDYANAMDSDATGYHLYDWMKLWHGGPKNASEALLKEHGIPGIRYLDGNSRAAGQGTSNYVMFPGTEDSIRILRKYGLMAPIAAGAGQGGDSP